MDTQNNNFHFERMVLSERMKPLKRAAEDLEEEFCDIESISFMFSDAEAKLTINFANSRGEFRLESQNDLTTGAYVCTLFARRGQESEFSVAGEDVFNDVDSAISHIRFLVTQHASAINAGAINDSHAK